MVDSLIAKLRALLSEEQFSALNLDEYKAQIDAYKAQIAANEAKIAAYERRGRKMDRISDFLYATASQLHLNPSSSDSSGRKSNIRPIVNDEAVLQGFLPHKHEDVICAATWAQVKSLKRPTEEGDDDVKTVHSYIEQVFCAVKAAALEYGIECNRAFYEYKSHVNEEFQSDWMFMQPQEQRRFPHNQCFFMEAKPINNTDAERTDVLLRIGQAQVMRRIALRYKDTDEGTTLGIGAVVNCTDIMFLRINFDDHQNDEDVLFPCFVTNKLAFYADTEADCPLGLRYLVRLMLEHRAVAFGLPENGGFISPEIEYVRMLGLGGFGRVNEVLDTTDGSVCALKSIKYPSREGGSN